MRKLIVPGLSCVLFLSLAAFAEDAKPETEYQPRKDAEGWEILFDGKDMNAWAPNASWEINEQGELHPAKGGPSICTKARYCDFMLELDFKLGGKAKANSGVFIHIHNAGDEVSTGMEIQILDNADYNVKWDAMNACGALYDLVHPSEDANKPVGEWNHYRITVKDSNVTVEMNGKEIVKADLNQWTTPHVNPGGGHNKFPYAAGTLPREGFLSLQNYGGTPVWFKNVRLKTLSDRKPQYTGKEPIKDVLLKLDAK
ncbi:MAG: DUF1080 domain-containing protein [Planctomycetota bacterium]